MTHLLAIDPALIEWSRAQFALTAIYHWLFVPLTLGLALIMGIMETCYYRTGKQFWKDTANSCSSEFTLRTMFYVSLLVPFVFGYIAYVWRVMDRK